MHVPVHRPEPAFSQRRDGPPSPGTVGAGGAEAPPAGTEVDALTEGGGSPRASGCPGFPASREGPAGGREWGAGEGRSGGHGAGGGGEKGGAGRGGGREAGGRPEAGRRPAREICMSAGLLGPVVNLD